MAIKVEKHVSKLLVDDAHALLRLFADKDGNPKGCSLSPAQIKQLHALAGGLAQSVHAIVHSHLRAGAGAEQMELVA